MATAADRAAWGEEGFGEHDPDPSTRARARQGTSKDPTVTRAPSSRPDAATRARMRDADAAAKREYEATTPRSPVHAVGDRRTRVFPAKLTSNGAADSAAGVVLGLVGYALLINFLKGGPAQVKAWLSAKFVNRVTAPSSASSSSTSGSAPGTSKGAGKVAPPGTPGVLDPTPPGAPLRPGQIPGIGAPGSGTVSTGQFQMGVR